MAQSQTKRSIGSSGESSHLVINYYCMAQEYIVVPASMRQVTLKAIHQGCQSIQRCWLRVSTSVWWLGASRDMEHFISE